MMTGTVKLQPLTHGGKLRCQKIYLYYIGTWPKKRQCPSRAIVDDKWCRKHSPAAEKRREDDRAARQNARDRKYRFQWCGRSLYDALRLIRDGDNNPRETARQACALIDGDDET